MATKAKRAAAKSKEPAKAVRKALSKKVAPKKKAVAKKKVVRKTAPKRKVAARKSKAGGAERTLIVLFNLRRGVSALRPASASAAASRDWNASAEL